jgi:hypothetical protein
MGKSLRFDVVPANRSRRPGRLHKPGYRTTSAVIGAGHLPLGVSRGNERLILEYSNGPNDYK